MTNKQKIYKKYNQSEKGKQAQAKYRKSDKYREASKRYRASKKCKIRQKENNLKRLYNITLKKHAQLYAEQNGTCKLCARSMDYDKMHTDHDHSSGRVRGLLCISCNLYLGWYEKYKDSIKTYLRKPK